MNLYFACINVIFNLLFLTQLSSGNTILSWKYSVDFNGPQGCVLGSKCAVIATIMTVSFSPRYFSRKLVTVIFASADANFDYFPSAKFNKFL
jgi:hypothetical protein